MLSYFVRQQPRGKDNIKIKEIPHLTSPERISQLNFSFNDIRTIPAHITSVLNLQIIDLSHNKIAKIEYVYLLPTLKFINLSHNLISEVPNEMTQLVQIQNLDLSFNKIAILNNIKVLKQLVELRTFDFQGFLEVNLEGNQILRKKGCKEIYKKWMNPSIEEYKKHSRQDQRDGYLHLTKKRNSKSLELHHRETSAMVTHRTHLISQKLEETKQFEFKKRQEEKSNSIMKQSIQMTEKMSPNFVNSQERSDMKANGLIVKSEMLNSFQNYRDLSKIYESITIQDINNLGEWFCATIDELNDLADKFSLITSNEDINTLSYEIKSKLYEESTYARQIVFICLQTVKQALDNRLTKELQKKFIDDISEIDNKIKEHHLQILKDLSSNTQSLPIRLYKVWVSLYRKLKTVISQIPEKVEMHKFSCVREQQIQQLFSISPDKKNKLMLPSHEKRQETSKNESDKKLGSSKKDKLNELLFSNKSECLLLSEQKNARSSSEKKSAHRGDNDECENCLMLKWINTKSKEQLSDLTERVHVLERERVEHIGLIQNLEKFKEKYVNLAGRQELIIGELQYLHPCTYQNFLLEQAKTIEYMLNTSDLVDYKQISSQQLSGSPQEQQLRGYTSKQIEKDKSGLLNTRLSSSKNGKSNSNHNKVSEFTIEAKKEMITKESNNTIRGSSYFKSKNIVTTVNRSNDDLKAQVISESLESEQNRPKAELAHNMQEVVVSQFNSMENTSNKNKNAVFQYFAQKMDEKEKASNHRKATEKSSKIENDIILISEGSDTKDAVDLEGQQTLKLNQKDSKSKMFQYLKSEQFNVLLRQKLIDSHTNLPNHNRQMKPLKQTDSSKFAAKSFNQKHPKRMNSELSDKQNRRPEVLKRNKTSERLYNDAQTHCTYVPMESQQAETYKKYMKYHLRNNIIEILFKKNNCIADAGTHEKYSQVTKTQKLINKKNNTQRSHNVEQAFSKRGQINKTFR